MGWCALYLTVSPNASLIRISVIERSGLLLIYTLTSFSSSLPSILLLPSAIMHWSFLKHTTKLQPIHSFNHKHKIDKKQCSIIVQSSNSHDISRWMHAHKSMYFICMPFTQNRKSWNAVKSNWINPTISIIQSFYGNWFSPQVGLGLFQCVKSIFIFNFI